MRQEWRGELHPRDRRGRFAGVLERLAREKRIAARALGRYGQRERAPGVGQTLHGGLRSPGLDRRLFDTSAIPEYEGDEGSVLSAILKRRHGVSLNEDERRAYARAVAGGEIDVEAERRMQAAARGMERPRLSKTASGGHYSVKLADGSRRIVKAASSRKAVRSIPGAVFAVPAEGKASPGGPRSDLEAAKARSRELARRSETGYPRTHFGGYTPEEMAASQTLSRARSEARRDAYRRGRRQPIGKASPGVRDRGNSIGVADPKDPRERAAQAQRFRSELASRGARMGEGEYYMKKGWLDRYERGAASPGAMAVGGPGNAVGVGGGASRLTPDVLRRMGDRNEVYAAGLRPGDPVARAAQALADMYRAQEQARPGSHEHALASAEVERTWKGLDMVSRARARRLAQHMTGRDPAPVARAA